MRFLKQNIRPSSLTQPMDGTSLFCSVPSSFTGVIFMYLGTVFWAGYILALALRPGLGSLDAQVLDCALNSNALSLPKNGSIARGHHM